VPDPDAMLRDLLVQAIDTCSALAGRDPNRDAVRTEPCGWPHAGAAEGSESRTRQLGRVGRALMAPQPGASRSSGRPDHSRHATISSAAVVVGGMARRLLLVVTAYILIQTEVGKAAQVAKDIVEITGVQQADDVTGPYDVIARAEARNLDELGRLVVARVQVVDGITRTLTCPVVRL
jgi:DNA-binding Lrp family transcriptional regulator